MLGEDKIIENYARQHQKIGKDFIGDKISYEEYIRRTSICAVYADKKMKGGINEKENPKE